MFWRVFSGRGLEDWSDLEMPRWLERLRKVLEREELGRWELVVRRGGGSCLKRAYFIEKAKKYEIGDVMFLDSGRWKNHHKHRGQKIAKRAKYSFCTARKQFL